jgi:hypothetical protein
LTFFSFSFKRPAKLDSRRYDEVIEWIEFSICISKQSHGLQKVFLNQHKNIYGEEKKNYISFLTFRLDSFYWNFFCDKLLFQ